MTPALELRWTYSPEEFFEEPLAFRLLGCEITINPGIVVATINLSTLESDPKLRSRVEAHVTNTFLGVQVQSHVRFELSKPTVAHLNADGSKGIVIECEPGHLVWRGHKADLRYTRSDGVVVDTRDERVRQKRTFGQFAASLAPKDQTLSRMLKSYDAAVRDPADELVHLYEVRDSATARFSSEAAAISTLQICRKDWSRLGRICNELPLKEGRHRGKAAATLRPATEEELMEARDLTAAVIQAYMSFVRVSSE
jgi:hypothetical protein